MKGATTIQERLWELRKDKGLNLEELAEKTGISKSAHFSRNGRDGRIAVFGVMFRGDFQGKGGHRAALKSPIVSWTGQTTPRRFVMFG